MGLCQCRKTALRTLVVTFDTAHCSDKKLYLFKRFNFSVHKATSTVELRVLEDCCGKCFSWYTAVKTTV